MDIPELTALDVHRVRWLCAATPEVARQLCQDVKLDDPPAVHCARFALHLTLKVPLPERYAWEVVQAYRYPQGQCAYTAPLIGHVRLMAMSAVNSLDQLGSIPDDLLAADDFSLGPMLQFRVGQSRVAFDDDRIQELSFSADYHVRQAVARSLRYRPCANRNQILTRLMDDPRWCVAHAAAHVAAQIGDPVLRDLVAAKRNFFSLALVGDPRGRERVEALAFSDDPDAWEEGVGIALILGDRDILTRLWRHPDWVSRRNAILSSAHKGLLEASELPELLSSESPDHLAEVLLSWPAEAASAFPDLVAWLRSQNSDFPTCAAIAAAEGVVLEQARAWMAECPVYSGAIARMLPRAEALRLVNEMVASPHAGARCSAIRVIRLRDLVELYARVAELCLDVDESVVSEAAFAIRGGPLPCGVHGLDTAILRCGDDFSGCTLLRYDLSRLILRILEAEACPPN